MLRFGPMRALVEGLEAVLPDGSIHHGLTGLKKDNRGPSLDHLLIGAEGTLGIVTAARLKLVPAIASRSVAWLGLASPAAALAVLRALEAATDRVEGFEILPDESLGAALDHIPGTRAPLAGRHPWYALVEATSDSDEPVDLAALLAPLVERGLIADAAIAASEAQAAAMWRIRDSLSEAERAAFGPATQHDISVAVDAMPGFLASAAAAVEAAFPGTHASGFGHLGDGNIHFHVRAGSRGGARLAGARRRGGLAPRPRPRHRGGRIDQRRAWHRPDEARRARPARPGARRRTCARSRPRSTRAGSSTRGNWSSACCANQMTCLAPLPFCARAPRLRRPRSRHRQAPS